MLDRKFTSCATILLLVFIAIFYFFFHTKNEPIASRSSEPLNAPVSDAYDLRHNFRRLNKLITEYDPYIAGKVKALAERKAPANDRELVELAREMMDRPPVGVITKLSAGNARSTEQSTAVDAILKNQTRGKYIECGGYDGENASPTLFFEARRGWTGLLVEPDPAYYTQLLGKQRNIYSINACLSPQPYFSVMAFQYSGGSKFGQVGKLSKEQKDGADLGAGRVPCFPIETLLLALNWTTVDFFSLDVEGFELPVLQTIPWNKFNIRTLSVEYVHGIGGKAGITDYMISQNFKLEKQIDFTNHATTTYIKDLVFSKL